MSLTEKLQKIRSSPKLQNQQYTTALLNAIDDTLQSQNADPTPTAYFAALLSLLSRSGAIEKEYSESRDILHGLVYLLDLVSREVPAPLLRSKYSIILPLLTPSLTHAEAEAPLVRSSIGTLESLLVAQDAQAWKLPATDPSPRRGLALLLVFTLDARPKVRKRALDALLLVLDTPPPSPLIGHPAIDMCAEFVLQKLHHATDTKTIDRPTMLHTLHLAKPVAAVAYAWSSSSIETLCQLILDLSRSNDQQVVMACFDVFEAMFAGMNGHPSDKLPQILHVIAQLQPAREDTHLLPTWVAILARAYEVSAQNNPHDTFSKLPDVFGLVASFLSSSSDNIRISASECLISLVSNCISDTVLESSPDTATLEKMGTVTAGLLGVKYQGAWAEVFGVITVMLKTLKSKAFPTMKLAVQTVGDLRSNEAFNGKKEADLVLSAAITAVGPKAVLKLLPLNLAQPKQGQPGRAWLLPLMRTAVKNTKLNHFKSEMLPLSDAMASRAVAGGAGLEVKIFETLVQQIWATLPGYCLYTTDLTEAFDQAFAEQLATVLYEAPLLRQVICRGLRNLVESNQDNENAEHVLSSSDRERNLAHLSVFANSLLAVLFNTYSQTLPQNRIAIVECINAYVKVLPKQQLIETFDRVVAMFTTALDEPKPASTPKNIPSTAHTLMDLVVIMAVYLPQESYESLSRLTSLTINRDDDPQMQKKAYKLFSRLADSETGKLLLRERNEELQQLFLAAGSKVSVPARRDRMSAISCIIPDLPITDLHFIPSILSEAVIAVKETNEKARVAAFDLLVLMGERMAQGGQVINSKVPHMADDASSAPASLEEFFTMVSAGLAGSTPHMISASITALARLLYEFRTQLSEAAIVDLVQTIDLFLTSQNREIVRSCLGFVKVCVLSLPTDLMLPRLSSMIPNLCVWSHEHKAQFKAKVKHIFERLIRRFGIEVVQEHTPQADAKLITNIRKSKERAKRKRDTAEETKTEELPKRKGNFESEYDQALYESEGSASEAGDSDNEMLGRSSKDKRTKTEAKGRSYIIEGGDEPFDLLDKQALARVSSTKPQKQPAMKSKRARLDVDGKLILDGKNDADVNEFDDIDVDMDSKTLGQGIDAYVDAICGSEAARTGQKGRLKFANKPKKRDEDDEMDIDENETPSNAKYQSQSRSSTRGRLGPGLAQGRVRGRGYSKMQSGRPGLGVDKQREQGRPSADRVTKPGRSKRGGAPRGRRS